MSQRMVGKREAQPADVENRTQAATATDSSARVQPPEKRHTNSDRPILLIGARENNLKNVSIEIPKHRIVVFTGVSGSGKSSLVFDTIAAESQRQLNETFGTFARHRLPHYGQPDADVIQNLSPAIIVDQKRIGGNARSTVGTITDIYALLRLLFSRAGRPQAGESTAFSFNHNDGMCPTCHGLGTTEQVDVRRLLDRDKSLNEGAIRFPALAVGSARWKRYVWSGLFDNDKPLKHYTDEEWDLLLNAKPFSPPKPNRKWGSTMKYEGLLHRFQRSFMRDARSTVKGPSRAALDEVLINRTCPQCKGARLNAKALRSKIDGKNIAQCAALQCDELSAFVAALDVPEASTVAAAIVDRLDHLTGIGLGYLSLDRETTTLSGGESQRVKMVKHLGSSLTGMSYIFDEPSVGLHARDVHQLNAMLRRLRDKGNSVLVVEHDPDVIAIADEIVDMGPGAGRLGGEVVYQGSVAGLKRSSTLTGRFFARHKRLKSAPRIARDWLPVRNARLHNLKGVTVAFPVGVLTVVSGVAGSGKSSLVNGEFAHRFPDVVCIDQSALRGSRRSNTASYTGLLDGIRRQFAQANQVDVGLFSANSSGACPECNGLGLIEIDLAFMDPIERVCESCAGRRFRAEVLQYKLHGLAIDEVLRLTVADARAFFAESDLQRMLRQLEDVGLGYLSLGQPLSTLSGGERQRVKLAMELEREGGIYILDEPTTGLHLSDVDRLLGLMERLVDNGATLIVIEHNLEVMAQADWIVDIGPGAGRDGGRVVYQGPVLDLPTAKESVTAAHLKRYVEAGGE
ncbi:excinuclease ABC subunit UvrA [Lysobacter enzymogenes]|uniref:excinuclease ABC subunit UvrA n=1 Tax=Lysobacter enzymogenes TaxID=69 RepID=UPI0033968ABE